MPASWGIKGSRQKAPQSTIATPASAPDLVEPVLENVEATRSISSETTYHLTGSKLYLVLGGLGLAIYLFALDISVLATVPVLLKSQLM